MLRMVFSSPGAWKAAKALVNQRHTHKRQIYTAAALWGRGLLASASSGLLFCRRRWEVDGDSGLPLGVKTAPVQTVGNKPSAEKSRVKLWICHTASALRPTEFELLIGVAVNT